MMDDDDTQEYAHQRQWVGLTDAEIDTLRKSVNPYLSFEQGALLFARAIEAKLKEKNHG
jgi:hypothetical protein